MNKENDIKKVIHLIAWWLSKLELNEFIDLFDLNKITEDIVLMLLNEIYGYQLVNLNHKKHNFSAIDLGDTENGIAFQVTTRTDIYKIEKNLKTFIKEHKTDYPKGIRFLILSMEESKIRNLKRSKRLKNIDLNFNPGKHILSMKEIIREIETLYVEDRERFNRVKQILEEEIAVKP
ncbi:MAG TPA: SMEK domain-containing protein [Candidatus Deferrimicrobium sp.]|nr:SMEK domain-containing protein [Candidatus Deferrimicrobium sp.]